MLQLIEQVHIFQENYEAHIFWKGASEAEPLQKNVNGVNNR